MDQAGASALLGKGAMEAGYWSLQPVGRALIALGFNANGVTLVSLGFGLTAAVALSLGHFGVGAAFTAVATLGDALDGIVARQTGTASNAGEVFDAAVDRYQEFFFLGGLAVYFRADAVALVLTLLALLGSFMVSYGTAKAEALGVESPRGAMRRVERAVYLGAGVVFAPVAGRARGALRAGGVDRAPAHPPRARAGGRRGQRLRRAPPPRRGPRRHPAGRGLAPGPAAAVHHGVVAPRLRLVRPQPLRRRGSRRRRPLRCPHPLGASPLLVARCGRSSAGIR